MNSRRLLLLSLLTVPAFAMADSGQYSEQMHQTNSGAIEITPAFSYTMVNQKMKDTAAPITKYSLEGYALACER